MAGLRAAAVCLLLAQLSGAFEQGEQVPLYANKVGPFANPSELYHYYSLPFCRPKEIEEKWLELGEVLKGDRAHRTLYDIRFGQNTQLSSLCKVTLDQSSASKFKQAVVDDYYFEMLLDDLPIWGYVGELESASGAVALAGGGAAAAAAAAEDNSTRYYLFTHLDFSLSYNGGHVIEVNVSADPLQRKEIGNAVGQQVEFTYAVRWTATDTPFDRRMERYSQYSFMPASFEIHWLSIINSFVLVLLLTGFLAIILMRVLKNDFTRYTQSDAALEDEEEETGWKLVHADVFRFPQYGSLLCALLGTGAQLLALVFALLILALMNTFYPGNRGAIYSAAVVLYALTAGIAGFVSAASFAHFAGAGAGGRWAFNLVLAACLYPVPFFVVFSFLNTVAIAYDSSAALPFGTICIVVLLWALVSAPLAVVGGLAGRNWAQRAPFEPPCRSSKIPREIPHMPWFRQSACQVFMAGFLPFSAIYIELHYIFASVWGHKLYTLYGVLAIATVMLVVVTSFITIALTYFQLAIEDHRWWWRSFFSGGSTGFFVFGYSAFYYFNRSSMFGFMQTSFFFGYMGLMSFAAFAMLGVIGFFSAFAFVSRIYKAIKCD